MFICIAVFATALQAQALELELLAFRPSLHFEDDGKFLFTVRITDALPHTDYDLKSFHHTDLPYQQEKITVTTDAAGSVSVRITSFCTSPPVGGDPVGSVYVELSGGGLSAPVRSNPLECACLRTISDATDFIYRPSPPGADTISLWLEDGAGETGLAGTVTILRNGSPLVSEQPLTDDDGGRYSYAWPIMGLSLTDDYLVQLTLADGSGNTSGLDGWVKFQDRAMWVWDEAEGDDEDNRSIWALLTNEDHDRNGRGDRDEWLEFHDRPYGTLDPSVSTSYFGIYPYVNLESGAVYQGTDYAPAIREFLALAHAAGIRVEALIGTPEWVERDEEGGLTDGKGMCDAILEFNRTSSTVAERFDGIHLDVEHDIWTLERWSRFMGLLSDCRVRIDAYNQEHEALVFGADLPLRFWDTTSAEHSGEPESVWDVLALVDYLTVMDYRDFADERWNGDTHGIIHFGEPFLEAGKAAGRDVVIGVELTANDDNYVTFFEETTAEMERELRQAAWYFAGQPNFKGFAIHSYFPWKAKIADETEEPVPPTPSPAAIPEPTTFLLFGIGLLSVFIFLRKIL